MTIKAYGESHIGCVRQENQDTFCISDITNGKLAFICDGMGGAAGGRLAAELASEAFCRRFSSAYEDVVGQNEPAEFDVHRVYSDAVYAANHAVFDRAVTEENLKGMGTTLVAACLTGGKLFAANVGDSRVYLFRGDKLTRISRDDSCVQQMIDEGRLTEEEAYAHEQRNLLTRALGITPYVECNFYMADVQAGDIVLLCSDGLTTHFRDAEIESAMEKGKSMPMLVKDFLQETLARGAKDNTTLIGLQIDG